MHSTITKWLVRRLSPTNCDSTPSTAVNSRIRPGIQRASFCPYVVARPSQSGTSEAGRVDTRRNPLIIRGSSDVSCARRIWGLSQNLQNQGASVKHDLHPTDSSGDPDVPSLEGRRVMLVPFHRRHIAFLYSLATDPAIGFRWRLRGGVPSIESFEASLWQAVLCQLIIETKSNQQPVGHVVAYNPNHNSGHCAVAIIMDANPSYKSLGLDGLQVFLGHLFSVYSFRKIYFEVPSYNIGQFRSALGTAAESGRPEIHAG